MKMRKKLHINFAFRQKRKGAIFKVCLKHRTTEKNGCKDCTFTVIVQINIKALKIAAPFTATGIILVWGLNYTEFEHVIQLFQNLL